MEGTFHPLTMLANPLEEYSFCLFPLHSAKSDVVLHLRGSRGEDDEVLDQELFLCELHQVSAPLRRTRCNHYCSCIDHSRNRRFFSERYWSGAIAVTGLRNIGGRIDEHHREVSVVISQK